MSHTWSTTASAGSPREPASTPNRVGLVRSRAPRSARADRAPTALRPARPERSRQTKGNAADTEFCKLLARHRAARAGPSRAEPPPEQTQAEFDDIAELLAQAEVAAPAKLTADIATFADAIDEYRGALAEVGYNLAPSTAPPRASRRVTTPPHVLSPAVVRHMKGPCGIAPNGGEERSAVADDQLVAVRVAEMPTNGWPSTSSTPVRRRRPAPRRSA